MYDLIDSNVPVSGTSLQGTVKCTYEDLVETLGEPHIQGGDKTTAEWSLLFDDDDGFKYSATIYDWKTDSTPMGEYDWHVGGYGREAVWAVHDLMGVSG